VCEKSKNPGQIKFAIDAPKHISIHRGEIQERINNGEAWEKP
jgi:carbon storage regulator CsrA